MKNKKIMIILIVVIIVLVFAFSLFMVIDSLNKSAQEEKKNADSNLYYKSLISMREEAKLEFSDTKLRDEYKEYVNKYK